MGRVEGDLSTGKVEEGSRLGWVVVKSLGREGSRQDGRRGTGEVGELPRSRGGTARKAGGRPC